jgi:hypothetical protein
MRILDLFFYVLYNFFKKFEAKLPTNTDEARALLVSLIISSLITTNLVYLFTRLNLKINIAVSFCILTFAIHFWFLYKNRYLLIYNKYKNENKGYFYESIITVIFILWSASLLLVIEL